MRRPWGQTKSSEQDEPTWSPSEKLDFELELGAIVAGENAQGVRVPMQDAEERLLGLTLLNDWSARDIQAWEYQPLGPFLSKNFATTVSPWIVTMEALAPFRKGFKRPATDPRPLSYLDDAGNDLRGAVDLQLEVWLQTANMVQAGTEPKLVSTSNFADAAYWTLAQMVTHHTSGGCRLQPGDLLGTGTLSGPHQGEAGSMLELTTNGAAPLELGAGERRGFLEDGDVVTFRAFAGRPGFKRIGFGECRTAVLGAT